MDDVYVFESAIDALSYLTIHKRDGKEWRDTNVLSLSGVTAAKKIPCALERYIQKHEVKRIVLCLDSDAAGKRATRCL